MAVVLLITFLLRTVGIRRIVFPLLCVRPLIVSCIVQIFNSKMSYNHYNNMTSEEKDKLCHNNQETIQEIISRRGDREKISTINPNQIKNSNSIKRQLTATSQYGDEETLIDEDNNPFITVDQNKRKQQSRNECQIIEINNDNVHGTIDITSSSTFTKTGRRLFINSSKRMSKNNNMLYDTQSPDMNHRQHSKERKRNDRTFARTTELDINIELSMFVKAKRNENGIVRIFSS